jgi:hypothetical protein
VVVKYLWIADGDGRSRLAEDEPGLGDEDELQDGVAPPVDERVEQGRQDDVAQDVRATAGVDAAALLRPFQRHLPVVLVGGNGFVLGPVVAPDGGELHRREKEKQDRQDRELSEECEDAAQGACSAPELHEAHEEPETGERGREEEQDPERADDLQEEPAPEKERANYRPARDALDGWVLGLPYFRWLDADVDLAFSAVRHAHVVRAEEVQAVPVGHATEDQALLFVRLCGVFSQNAPSIVHAQRTKG